MRFTKSLSNRSNQRRRHHERRFIPRLEALEDRCVPALITWTGLGTDHLWSTSANWNTLQVPVNGDDVVIPTNRGDTIGVFFDQNTPGQAVSLHSLVCDLPFEMAGVSPGVRTTLTLNGAGPFRFNNTLTLTAGFIGGDGTIDVGGQLNWSRSTMFGSGVTNANGGITFMDFPRITDTRIINNPGAATFLDNVGGFASGDNGVIFNNLPTGSFTIDGTHDFGVGTFNNQGTFIKGGGATGDNVSSFGGFNQTSATPVLVESGTLQLAGGTHTGDFEFTGAALQLSHSLVNLANNFNAGSHVHGTTLSVINDTVTNFNPGSVYNVTGSSNFNPAFQSTTTFNGTVISVGSTVNINRANVFINQDISTTTLSLDGQFGGAGLLAGSGRVDVSGPITWSGGAMGGTGTTNANGGMVLTGFLTISDTRTLNNAGVATYNGTTGHFFNNSTGAVFNNLATGSLTIDGNDDYNGGTFHNFGTFTKLAGATGDGVSQFAAAFTNAGTVQVGASSVLAVTSNYVQSAGSTILDNGTLNAFTTNVNINGGLLTGSGLIAGNVVNAGTVSPGLPMGILTIAGNYTQTAAGALGIEVSGPPPSGGGAAGTTFDQLDVQGHASVDGILNTSVLGPFVPVPDDVYPIIPHAGSVTGTFTTVDAHVFVDAYTATAINLLVVRPPIDVRITISPVTPNPAITGESYQYTITVTNAGPQAAHNVTLIDTFAQFSNVIDITSSTPNTFITPNTYEANFGTLAPGDVGTVTVHARSSQPGTFTDSATVSADENDPDTSNNNASITATVVPLLRRAAVWNGASTVSANWRDPANWVGNVAPVAGDDLVFSGATARLAAVNDFSADTVFHSITFDGGDFVLDGNRIVLGEGGITARAVNYTVMRMPAIYAPDPPPPPPSPAPPSPPPPPPPPARIIVEDGSTLELSGIISGSGDLQKEGPGTLILSGANTYGGATTVLQGILNLRNNSALGSTTAGTEIHTGTTLSLQDNLTVAEDLTLVGDPPGTPLPAVRIVSSGTNIVSGKLATNPLVLITTLDGTLTITGVISGNDDLMKDGAGTLVLSADNTLHGTITLLAGTLLVKGSQPNTPIIVQGGVLGGPGLLGPITFNGGQLQGPVFQASPIHPGRRDLVISGSNGDDAIRIKEDDDSNNIKVVIREKDYHVKIRGTFALPIDRIVVHGLAGDDNIQVEANVEIPAWLYGDAGNDHLKGGEGNDVLFGGDGCDVLIGDEGRDLLIGGTGSDRLVGSEGDDILIAGTTDFDANVMAVDAVMTEWTRGDASYSQRVSHLQQGGGLNGTVFLNDSTVHDDGSVDRLTGSSGRDWFFANRDSRGRDIVTNLLRNELWVDID